MKMKIMWAEGSQYRLYMKTLWGWRLIFHSWEHHEVVIYRQLVERAIKNQEAHEKMLRGIKDKLSVLKSGIGAYYPSKRAWIDYEIEERKRKSKEWLRSLRTDEEIEQFENEAAEVWKSLDGGESWINISDPSWINTRHIHNVRIDPSTGWLYAATGDTDGYDGVWRSKRKNGSDWTLKFSNRKNRLQFIGIAFKEGNIYLGCDSRFSKYSLYMTKDDGSSEKVLPEGITRWDGCGVFYLEKDSSGRLWATQRPLHAKGAIYTSDDGLNWTLRTRAEEESIQEWRSFSNLSPCSPSS